MMISFWKKSHGNRTMTSAASDIYTVADHVMAASGNMPTVHCKLCLTECLAKDMYMLETCRCSFCTECIRQYIEVCIDDGNVLSIPCPDFDCHHFGVINSSEIKKLVSPEHFNKFTRLHFEREIDLDPLRTFCPSANCDTVCLVSREDAASVSAVPVRCPTCGMSFCSLCKSTWHPSKSCDENMTLIFGQLDGIPFSSTEDAPIKRCPLCHVPIERDAGCAQMMCKICKHVFCWYCLTSLDDDILLRHYDKGQCKNKLGHSRASVIWHRVQVVGIFTGFGVLLLVASPFLLLIAPCILCCKCRRCRFGDDDDVNIPSSSV